MLLEDVIAFLKQFFFAGKTSSVKTPRRIAHQFFVPLIMLVRWSKKSLRIGGMYRYRNSQSSALFPDGIHALIVNRHQLAGLVPNAQSQVFQNFQPSRSTPDCIIQLLYHLGAELRVVNLAPVHLREHHEATR